MPSRPVAMIRDDDVVAVAQAVRHYVVSALPDADDADDIVQEAVSRLIANRWRVDRGAAPGYAIATARTLIISQRREDDLNQRHQHRLYEPGAEGDPVQLTLAAEEETILAAAFAVLGDRDQQLLLAHHVEGLSTADVAALRRSTPGAISAALARARGRLRLEYCLQAHRQRVTDPRCRSILTAIAVGDGRRQNSLGASRHLPVCEDCRTLSAAVTAPDRHGAMWGLVGLLAGLYALFRRLVTTHPATATAGGAVTVGTVTTVLLLLPHHHATPPKIATVAVAAVVPSPAPLPAPARRHGVISGPYDLLHLPPDADLASYVGRPVLGRSVPVLAVDANEGFWIGTSAQRLWVQLSSRGESAITVKAGTLVDFAGTVVANSPGFASRAGVSKTEDAAELNHERVHLAVAANDIATVR